MQDESTAMQEAVAEEVTQGSEESQEFQPEWSPEEEERARILGWKPESEWQGDKPPTGLIDDPRRYVERAESLLPFRKLQEQYSKLEGEIGKISKVYERALERDRQKAQAEIERLRGQQARAVEVGDTDAWKAAREQEDDLRKSLEPEQPKQQQGPSEAERAAIDRWRVDKDWFGKDPVMTSAASAIYGQAMKEGMSDPDAILATVDRRMKEEFPHKFGGQQRQQPAFEPALMGGQGKDEFSKLPADAKKAFERMVQQGLFENTKEGKAQYVRDYNEQ